MKRFFLQALRIMLPMAFAVVILFVLSRALMGGHSRFSDDVWLNRPLPAFTAENLLDSLPPLTDKVFRTHAVSLLNVWATWCYACHMEHEELMRIKNKYHIPIYGIAYKDDDAKVQAMLKKYGNPYVVIGLDRTGDIGIDLGLYGTPETFLVNRSGVVLYRHIGVLTKAIWEDEFLPRIQQAERPS